ncbi:hypothetical protein BDV59DRAFT_190652 [Aspergillus ambiguus]|uniref:uncharacterized protein n=1 Tax=Aspergillus ambiguus TaxID=176160 RepID=UPI003CCCB55E
MYYVPQRARTASSGACSYCVRKKQRCYIGVRGVPCSSCRRLKIPCNGRTVTEYTEAYGRTPAEIPAPGLTYCAEDLFAAQIQKSERKQRARAAENPAVPTTNPLDNYISIAYQLLGPDHGDGPLEVDLPNYVSELPARLDASDLEYLEGKGALCLPTARFRTELLKSYVLWVHPQVPILNLEEILLAIANNDGVNRIGLVLFHAVMFAASGFVDLAHIHDEGYPSREAARAVLFRRAKVLFELDCEDDRLSLVQAALLMIHWQDLPSGEKDASHWIGICLSLSTSIGLDRTPDGTGMTPSQRQAWKRTWWSVYNHARLTSEDLQSMMSIANDVPENGPDSTAISMVTLNDFRFGVFPPAARAVAGDCEVLRSVECQKTQALLFIEKTRLCCVSQFSTLSNQVKDLFHGSTVPDSRVCQPALSNTTVRLNEWTSRLPTAVRYQYPLKLSLSPWEKSIYLHRTWLRLLFIGLAYVAHREQSQMSGDALLEPAFLEGQLETSSRYLLDISNIFEEVHSLGLSSNLPSPAVALLLLVLTLHRRAVDTGTPATQTTASLKLRQCWNILNEMREPSEIAKVVTEILTENPAADIWEKLSSELLSQ